MPRRLIDRIDAAGGRSDFIDAYLASMYSCGTVLDFHQAFPITSSGCSPLEPERDFIIQVGRQLGLDRFSLTVVPS